MRNPLIRIGLALMATIAMAAPLRAQDREVPYWASLSSNEVNMRVGPNERYRISWVYRREGLPVKVVRLQQGWRLIEEPDGTQGWVFNQLLSLRRTAMVTGEELVPIREMPEGGSRLLWNMEPGVVGHLGECEAGWCQFDVEGHEGWVEEGRLWGAGAP
jgi:SH3-like domain-containing protein